MSELLNAVYSVAQEAPVVETTVVEAEAPVTQEEISASEYAETAATTAFDPNTYEQELTVDGEKVTVTAAEAFKAYQKAKAADKRFNELADAKRQFEAEQAAWQQKLQSDPESLLKEAGVDLETFIQRKMQEALLDPEDLAEIRRAEELENFQKEKAQYQQKQFEAQKAQHANKIGAELKNAFESASIPINPVNAFVALQVMTKASEAGRPLSAEHAVAQISGITEQMFKASVSKMTEDQIESLLGPEKLQSLQKRFAAKAKNNYKTANSVPRSGPASATTNKKEYKSFDAFLKDLQGF